MTVYLDDMPAEGIPFFVQGVEVHDIAVKTAQLDAVIVHDGGKIVQFKHPGGHGGFPGLAFVALPVAEQGVDTPRLIVQPARQRRTDGKR